jgi:competence protein ComEC
MLLTTLMVLIATVLAFVWPFSTAQLLISTVILYGLFLSAIRHQSSVFFTPPQDRQPIQRLFLIFSAFALLLTINQSRIQAWIENRVPDEMAGQQVAVQAAIDTFPRLHSYYQSVTANIRSTDHSSSYQRLRLYWPLEYELKPGQTWKLDCRIKPPNSVRSPGAFNPRISDFLRHIDGNCQVYSAVLIDEHQALLPLIRTRIRNWIRDQPVPVEMKAWALALMLGDKGWLTDQQLQQLKVSQTQHLFVVSGLHLSILFGWVSLILGLALKPWTLVTGGRSTKGIQLIAGLIAATAYAALCGFSVPTTRALIMLAVAVVMAFRPGYSWMNGLLLSLCIILVIDPAAIALASTWLSFLAVSVLILVFSGRKPLRQTAAFKLKEYWLKPQGYLLIALLPMQLGFGFGFNPLGFFVNLVAIPVMGTLLLPAVLASGLALFYPPFSQLLVFVEPLRIVLSEMMEVAEIGYSLSFINLQTLLLLALLSLLIVLPAKLPGRNALFGLLLVSVPLALFKPLKTQDGIKVIQFDVGQGQSVLVSYHNTHLLIDTGPGIEPGHGAFSRVVLPYLQRQQINHLNMVIISHGDQDHSSDLQAVKEAVDVRKWLSGEPLDVVSSICRAGQKWHFGELEVAVLFGGSPLDLQGNDASCVVRISHPNHGSILVPGDITKSVEYRLLDQFPASDLSSDLLLAGHHGSRTSSSWQWLKNVDPERIAVSAGTHNRFGHPHPEVTAKFDRLNIPWSKTGDTGSIQFELYQTRIREQALKPDRWYWLFD